MSEAEGTGILQRAEKQKGVADYAYMHIIGYSLGSSILLQLQSCDLVSW